MRTADWERVKAIFLEAIESAPESRQALVEARCEGDEELHEQVLRLLQQHEATGSGDAPDTPLWGSAAGLLGLVDRVGGYEILRVLGEGGMGVVYLARQEHPRRLVALKMIRPGLASASVLRRFEHEAQVLARLQHPGIAQIHEAGTVDAGSGPQPYFAMEYVRGRPLLEETRGWPVRRRLEVFLAICDALHHAHTRGVVHRDLKPANILVDETGAAKVLDFGVARVVESAGRLVTADTEAGRVVGTIPYMSPEQAAGALEEVDARSDVYALGVILFELLAGRPPLDAKDVRADEALRRIREESPPRLGVLERSLRGDLETIAAHAMEKDRSRRYPSAADLRGDVERYLRSEPILARPPSRVYQVRKLVQRHRGLAGTVAGAIAVLGVAAAVSTSMYVRAERALVVVERERDRAVRAEELAEERLRRVEIESAKSEQIASLTREILAGLDPEIAAEMDKTLLRMMLDRAAGRIEEGHISQYPEVEAALRETLGRSYLAIGELDTALHHMERAVAGLEAIPGADSMEVARVLNGLHRVYHQRGDFRAAEAVAIRVLDMRTAALGADHSDTLESQNNLASVYEHQNRFEEAETLYLAALERTVAQVGEIHERTATIWNNLGTLYYKWRRLEKAEEMFRRAAEHLGEALNQSNALLTWNSLAIVHIEMGRFEEAETALRTALEILERTHGLNHPQTLQTVVTLGWLCRLTGRLEVAISLMKRACEGMGPYPEHPVTLAARNNLAIMYYDQGKFEEARELDEGTLATRRRVLGDSHLETLTTMNNLASVYVKLRGFEKGEELFREAAAGFRMRLPGEVNTAHVIRGHGTALLELGRFAEAEELLREAHGVLSARLAADDPQRAGLHKLFVRLYGEWGKPEEAAVWQQLLPEPAVVGAASESPK